DEVKRFAECSFEPSSKVNTDALQSFQTALKDFEHHFEVFEKGDGDLRWVHTLISNVKSFVLGTYHGLGKKHLQAYFDEFAFRFNRRFWQDQLFSRLAYAVMDSHILGYVDLTR
ncbi:transposase, partial [Intestinimonas massiliensis]